MRICCDFDGPIPRDTEWRIRFAAWTIGFTVKYVRFDRTRNGWHMIVETRERFTPTELVLLQSLLGSDWKREVYNARRARTLSRQPALWRRAPRWNTLYTRHWREVTL